MKYCSTRGGSSGLTFEEALFSGYASDGGILLPEHIPKLNQDQLTDLSDKSYADIVKFVIGLYVGEEVNASEIDGECFTDSIFYADTFRNCDIS